MVTNQNKIRVNSENVNLHSDRSNIDSRYRPFDFSTCQARRAITVSRRCNELPFILILIYNVCIQLYNQIIIILNDIRPCNAGPRLQYWPITRSVSAASCFKLCLCGLDGGQLVNRLVSWDICQISV